MPAFMTEEERRRIAAKKQRDKLLSGIMGFGKQVYQSNPLLKAVGDPIRDVYRNYDAELQNGVPQIVRSAQHPLTIKVTHGPRPRPHLGLPKVVSPFSPGLVDNLTKKAANTGPFSPELIKSLQERGPGAKQHAGMEADAFVQPEEDEMQKYLRMMFLANLAKGMKGGPPPTPYGTAVGGGNKSWATLPSMRMK